MLSLRMSGVILPLYHVAVWHAKGELYLLFHEHLFCLLFRLSDTTAEVSVCSTVSISVPDWRQSFGIFLLLLNVHFYSALHKFYRQHGVVK